MERNSQKRHYDYRIDSEGNLSIKGSEITDPATLKFFMKHLEALPDGSFQVICMGEINRITAEDVPYVVQNISIHPERIELFFLGNYGETLDPSTLWIGKNHVLYCKIRNGNFSARFNRKSYWEIAQEVQQDSSENFYLSLGGLCYGISDRSHE